MSMTAAQMPAGQPEYGDAKYPFHITKEEERQLRLTDLFVSSVGGVAL
ncbi:hypothetical protein ABZ646_44170 [Streptomyces sp. NPDC007162]